MSFKRPKNALLHDDANTKFDYLSRDDIHLDINHCTDGENRVIYMPPTTFPKMGLRGELRRAFIVFFLHPYAFFMRIARIRSFSRIL